MPLLSSTAYETPDTTAYKTPEWAAAAVAEGKDPADVGSSNLALKIINGFTSLAAAAALTFTPVGAQAQGMISKEAFGKCEAELMANYADKIAEKPHLTDVYKRRRDQAIANLCPLVADNAVLDQRIAVADQRIAVADQRIAANRSDIATMDQRIAANRSDIATMDQRIAANRSDIAANKERAELFAQAKQVADRITAGSNNPEDFKDLNRIYADLQKKQSEPGVQEVAALLANLMFKNDKLAKAGV
jgi:hypothetical protein